MEKSTRRGVTEKKYAGFRKPTAFVLAFLLLISPIDAAFVGAQEATVQADTNISVPAETPIDATILEEIPAPVLTESAAVEPSSATTENTDTTPSDTETSAMSSTGGDVKTTIQDLKGTQLPKTDEASGALTYEYPISIPSGRNGMQPELSLYYNSQNKENSIFGKAWSVNIPSIERVNKKGTESVYSDSYFTSALDGELTKVDESGHYRARVENGSYNSYLFQNNVWTLTDKQGKTYTFGSSSGSRQDNAASTTEIYKWMVDEVRDANGNYISYQYFKDAGQIYPDVITYTNNGGDTGIFSVSFSREARNDNSVFYKSDFSIKNNYRINGIIINANGEWVKKYDMSYGTSSNATSLSFLKSITEQGKDEGGNTISLPPTNFLYQTHATSGWGGSGTWAIPGGVQFTDQTSNRPWDARVADINGDALPDIVTSKRVYTSTTTVQVSHFYMNTGAGWAEDTNWNIPGPFLDENGDNTGLRTADLNGDGLVDLYQSNKNFQGNITSAAWVNRGDGTGWDLDTNWVFPSVAFWDTAWHINPDGAEMVDVNGDGLPDIIKAMGNISGVYLNNGSGWVFSSSWTVPGGVEFTNQTSQIPWDARIADINGDALPDIVTSKRIFAGGGTQQVSHFYLNTGAGWSENTNWSVPIVFMDESGYDTGVRISDLNGDGMADLYLMNHDCSSSCTTTSAVWINRGDGTGWDAASDWVIPSTYFWDRWQKINPDGAEMVDINGDGFSEIVRARGNTTGVYLNEGKEELLSGVSLPAGGAMSIGYKYTPSYTDGSGNLLNPNLSFSLPTVSSMAANDGFGTIGTTTYAYEAGSYYRANLLDRKFAGFNNITKTDSAGNATKTYFHQGNASDSSYGEYADSFYKINKPYRIEQYDNSGNLYVKTINKWDSYSLGDSTAFVKLAQSVNSTYDGDSSHKDKAESSGYDNATGNLNQKIQYGEVIGADDGTFSDTGSDMASTTIQYAASSTAAVYLLSQETVQDQNMNMVRETKYYYDNQSLGLLTKGNLTKREMWESGSTYASTTKTYNTYGLVTQEKDGNGNATNYTYDPYNLFVATSTNALGYTRGFLYDYSSGKVKQLIDENNRVFTTTYDGLDRVTEEKQPDLTTPSTLVTKSTYAYTDTTLAVATQKTSYLDGSLTHADYAYQDGLGRIVQTRSQAEGSNYSMRDFVFNNRGLLDKESLPYFSSGSAKTSPTGTSALYSTYTYDPVERITNTATAVGNTSNVYNDWTVTTTDPNGKVKNFTKDAYGNLASVVEHNGSNYTTAYTYDRANNLTGITDALGNVRTFAYDGLGRRLAAQDLHASGDGTYGTYTFTYDDAGNQIQRIDPKSQTVNWTYDALNRPTGEDYAGGAGTEISYTYDSGTDGKTRLTQAVVLNSATTTYAYNPLGQTKISTTTINGTAYASAYEYDRQGNQTLITNPDSSQVKNIYNAAGLPDALQRKESTDEAFVNVVSNFDYGPHGKVSAQTNANGTAVTNTYDDTKLYRLSRRQTSGPGGNGGATTTVNFFSVGGDGSAYYNSSNSWSTTHNALTGSSAGYTGTTLNVNSGKYNTSKYKIERAFLSFDTSSLPDNAVINGATLKVYIDSKLNNDNDGDDFASVVQGMEQSTSTLATADYDTAGSVNTPTEGIDPAERKDITNATTSAYLVFNLNTVGKSWITATSTTKLALREGHDINNTAFVGSSGQYDQLTVRTSEYAGTTTDPVLEITHASTPPTPAVLQDSTYAYDNNGNITQIIDASGTDSAKTTAYTYDDLNRLTSATVTNAANGNNTAKVYTYDPLGNIASSTDAGIYAYAGTNYANPHAATQIGTKAQAYDQNGNLTNDGTFTYTWDYKNRLTQSGNGIATSTYAYDQNDNRVKLTSGGTTTIYPTKLYNTDGTTLQKHIFASDTLIATVKGTGANATTTYDHTDQINGTGPITDGNGGMVQLLDYHPYGTMRVDWQYGNQDEQRKFAGTEYDRTSGLNYMQARYYSGNRGQFISQDPVFWEVGQTSDGKSALLNPQSLNSYGYANDNPITKSDPTGRFAPAVIGAGLLLSSIIGGLGLSTYGSYIGNTEFIKAGFALQDIGIAGGSGFVQSSGINVLTGAKNEPLVVKGKTTLSGVQANKAAGNAFEAQTAKAMQSSLSGIVDQLTLKTGSGVKVRMDLVGRDSSGSICLVECKSSFTAPLTKNQSLAFPEIGKSGATVVGKGKEGFPGGTTIPATQVNIVRPQ